SLKANRQLSVPTRPVTSLGQPGLRVGSRPLVMERPSKRARLSPDPSRAGENRQVTTSTPLVSLHRAITPPPRSRSRQSPGLNTACPELKNDQILTQEPELTEAISNKAPRIIPSPVQLSHVEGFPSTKGYNVDTIRLRDILGDPMIRECWNFNYLFDVDFVMNQFDEDVRRLVQVKIVHGSWEREAANRIRVEEACARYPNVEPIIAYMPERFGTHHSKMMILLRHDDLAQVIIHTANMIRGDWTNMTQAVWRSPLLPLSPAESSTSSHAQSAIGTGSRFKRDLLSYLKAYGPKKTGSLVQQLNHHDFGSIRAALVASVPSKQDFGILNSEVATIWGWPALRDLMNRIPIKKHPKDGKGSSGLKPHIVAQISSVASLGQTDKWLKDVFFESLAPAAKPRPKYSIIFPTPDEIRRSLDGYGSGGSIHMKIQSAPQQKQLQYMRPHLCHWAGDNPSNTNFVDLSEDKPRKREAGRGRAAPHIKTYIRFSDAETMDTIDWAMVTSANLSTQAWGAATNANGEVRISSWEIGIVVWPELFVDDSTSSNPTSESSALMVPCFKRDRPSSAPDTVGKEPSTIVGFRLPYDLPLTPYSASDEPWCATKSHDLPDWQGLSWAV
ncbi:hypothetical protein N7523_009918, partial [Penicillium sp. IBT 18751x]